MRPSVKKTTSEITYDIKEPDFKPKHKKPLPKKYFKKGYNGFEPKSIEFEMFYTVYQYLGGLNFILRAGNNQRRTTKRTPDNYCLFQDKVLRYGDLEERRNIRRDIIRYTNGLERQLGFEKDEIGTMIGWIQYRYDKFASEIITEKVVKDAISRMDGIDRYMSNRAMCLVGFLTNDNSREGLRLRVFALITEKKK